MCGIVLWLCCCVTFVVVLQVLCSVTQSLGFSVSSRAGRRVWPSLSLPLSTNHPILWLSLATTHHLLWLPLASTRLLLSSLAASSGRGTDAWRPSPLRIDGPQTGPETVSPLLYNCNSIPPNLTVRCISPCLTVNVLSLWVWL